MALLTERQVDAVRLLGEGLSRKQIAGLLGHSISSKCVEYHLKQAHRAANVQSDIELLHWALTKGIVQTPRKTVSGLLRQIASVFKSFTSKEFMALIREHNHKEFSARKVLARATKRGWLRKPCYGGYEVAIDPKLWHP